MARKAEKEETTLVAHTLDGRPYHVAGVTLDARPRTLRVVDEPSKADEISARQAARIAKIAEKATTSAGKPRIHVGEARREQGEIARLKAEIERLKSEVAALRVSRDKPETAGKEGGAA